MPYATRLLCPVCGAVMDIIKHETPEPSAMGLALLGNDGRYLHRKESPQCAKRSEWIEGWKEETEELQ